MTLCRFAHLIGSIQAPELLISQVTLSHDMGSPLLTAIELDYALITESCSSCQRSKEKKKLFQFFGAVDSEINKKNIELPRPRSEKMLFMSYRFGVSQILSVSTTTTKKKGRQLQLQHLPDLAGP